MTGELASAYAGSVHGADEGVRDGRPLPAYVDVFALLERLGPAGLRERSARRDALQVARGMTFPLPSADGLAAGGLAADGLAAAGPGSADGGQRLLPLDLVPRLVAAREWQLLARGLEQRARALTALLRDLAGPRECVRADIVPAALVPGAPVLATGTTAPPATVAGMDLLHDGNGWRVLEDNLRVPSGLGYAVLVREIAAQALPELAPGPAVADPADALPLLGAALRGAAPPRCAEEPAVAVLTAGAGDSAHAEHALLAARLGIPLLTPADLLARGDTVAGPDGRVDVLYRRLDEQELGRATLGDGRPALEVLTSAVRAGTLGLANALGTGVADDKAVCASVPGLVDFFLGEPPLLAGVRTWVLADPPALAEALYRLHELVVKPVDGYGGQGVVFGAQLAREELARLRATIERDPAGWVAQEPVEASTHPTLAAEGALVPCAVDLRAFVVSGADASGRPDPDAAVAVPAALTRVAPPGSRVVNSSRGGGTKDTWLLA